MSTLDEEGREFFDWQGIKIFQQETVHKVGTDAVLLASWTTRLVKEAPAFILDAGTGSGILALMMAKTFPASKIYAVDIDEQALKLAEQNASNALNGDAIIVSFENILESPTSGAPAFHLAISNPPFYSTTNLPDREHKARAKHASAPVAAWIAGLISRLSPSGQVCIIVPAETAVQWISAANQMGYYNQHRMEVFSFHADPKPKRTLLHFGRDLIKPTFGQIIIYKANLSYSTEYLELTGIRTGK